MQSLVSNQPKLSDVQLLRNLQTHQNIHRANLERYQKIYKQYESHLKQDLQRQKAQLQNSEIVENLLKKLKKQIFDQLKQLDSLQNKGGLTTGQDSNERQSLTKKKDNSQSEKFTNHQFSQHLNQFKNENIVNLQRLMQQRDSNIFHFHEEYIKLKSETEKYKKLYAQLNQRLSQQPTLQDQLKSDERIRHLQYFQPHKLKRKLEILINQKKNLSQTVKELDFQLRKYKYLHENQNSLANSVKTNRQSLSLQQQMKRLAQQLSKTKKELSERQKLDSFQRKQFQLKLLLKNKQVQEYKQEVQEISKRLKISQSQVAKLQVEAKQLKEIRDESNLLKMKLFGLQNMHNIKKELPFASENIPQLIRSQIFNKKSKSNSKENSKGNSKNQKYLIRQEQLLNQRQEQRHIKQDMIRQNLASSLKHYKKKCSELQRRLNEREQQVQVFTEKSKQKIGEYNSLIQKLHNELERSYLQNAERSQKTGLAHIYRNFQQKIDVVSTKNSEINRQIAEKQELFNKEREKFENQKKHLAQQLERIVTENNQLKKANRQSKNQLLQQKLNIDVWKSQNSNNLSSQKTKSFVFSLNQQITLLRSQLQEKNDILLKQTSKNQRLSQLNGSLTASLEEAKAEAQQLRQKNQQFQTKLNESSNKFSQQLQTTKQKLQLEELSAHNLQKKLAHYINEKKEYQIRVKQLQETLETVSHQNQQKSLQIMRINHENEQLVSRIEKLEQQFDILEQRGSSLKKIQFLNRSSQLETQIYSLKRKYSQTLHSLNLKQHQIQYLRSQCDRYIQQNLKYIKFIKQQGLQISQSFLKDQKQLEEQKFNKIKHLQQRNSNLVQDNQLLKNLVEEMRSKLIDKTMPSAAILASKHEDEIFQLRNALLNAQKTIEHYKSQIQELQQRCNTEKSIFKDQWNKLIAEYNERSKSQKSSQQNLSQSAKMQKQASIEQLQSSKQLKEQLSRKQLQIKTLKNELSAVCQQIKEKKGVEIFEEQKVPSYFKQLITLRQQVQNFKHQRFLIQDKLRELEQQNSSLKIKLISSNKYQSPQKLSYPQNLVKTDLMRNQESNISFKSVQMDQKVISSLKTQQRESQPFKQTKTGLFNNLASLAPLVQSVRGQQSFTRLSNESKLSK